MNCEKLKKQCPGYRSPIDTILRNETKSTERKARAKKSRKPAASLPEFDWSSLAEGRLVQHSRHSSVSSTSSSSSDSIGWMSQYSPTEPSNWLARATSQSRPSSMYQPLSIPVEQQAICFFFSNYVLLPRGNNVYGYMTYLMPLLKEQDLGSTFSLSLSAVALASFGNRPNSKPLLSKASQQYAKALKSVNAALRDPKLVKLDHTLASVLLLGLFEVRALHRLRFHWLTSARQFAPPECIWVGMTI